MHPTKGVPLHSHQPCKGEPCTPRTQHPLQGGPPRVPTAPKWGPQRPSCAPGCCCPWPRCSCPWRHLAARGLGGGRAPAAPRFLGALGTAPRGPRAWEGAAVAPRHPPGASPRRAGTRRVPSVVQDGAAQGLLCSEVTGKGIKSLKAEGERGTELTAAPQLAQGTCKELGVPRAQGRHGSGATTGCPLLWGRRLGGHLPGNSSQKNKIQNKKLKGREG